MEFERGGGFSKEAAVEAVDTRHRGWVRRFVSSDGVKAWRPRKRYRGSGAWWCAYLHNILIVNTAFIAGIAHFVPDWKAEAW